MPRALVRNVYLRLLGLIFLAAFLSLRWQVDVLIGSQGLLPAAPYFEALKQAGLQWQAPSLFLLGAGDGLLRGGALLGALLSFGLILDFAPRYCLLALWLLYLSYVHAGQDFFSFQWDNLLLEAAFFSLFVTPRGWRARQAPPPHPAAVFLMLWLVFRLHFESGAAKLLSGDPTWRNLTAMEAYYETAPLPTWIGWYAHQLSPGALRFTALLTFVVELGLPFFLWAPHRIRGAVFAVLVAMQLAIRLTANYAFFNDLTIALCLFVLDDEHLRWLLRRVPLRFRPRLDEPHAARPGGTLAWTLAATLAALSLVPFTPWFPLPTAAHRLLAPIHYALNTTRSINAYHLFASMTLVRREAVVEGSDDGIEWRSYDFVHKPGDTDRAPDIVAPHQPRVDFQMWFLLLRSGPAPPYFDTLLTRLLQGSHAVDPLFRRNPFPSTPPRFVRVAIYRYRFTDAATRSATGDWWQRELLGFSQPRQLH